VAKLYFRYGAMNSAKTLNLLAVAHNYAQQGKQVLLMTPRTDDRYGVGCVRSRAGLQKEADLVIEGDIDLLDRSYEGISCILVDEAQFIHPDHIDQLRRITLRDNIPVICYGLRADFRNHLFEGSRRLMELADAIEEVKTTCHFCNRKATANLKYCDGVATLAGSSVDVGNGSEEKFLPACFACYLNQLERAGIPWEFAAAAAR